MKFSKYISQQILFSSADNGDGEIRTLDPLLARQVLSQLSYTPIWNIVNFLFLIWQPPTLPCRLQRSTIGRLGLNHRVRDGNGWTLALISTNYIAAAFAVTTIIFTFPLSVKRKMVTRTGFEPMLKA